MNDALVLCVVGEFARLLIVCVLRSKHGAWADLCGPVVASVPVCVGVAVFGGVPKDPDALLLVVSTFTVTVTYFFEFFVWTFVERSKTPYGLFVLVFLDLFV